MLGDFRPPVMSAINPLTTDVEFHSLVKEVNDLAEEVGPDKIGEKIEGLALAIMAKTEASPPSSGIGTTSESRINDFRDQAIQQIKNESLRRQMRQVLGLLKEGDLVCDYSQGNPDRFQKGREACSCICGEAVQHFLSGQTVRSEREMYALMQRGIDSYNRYHFSGIVEFDDTLNRMNAELAQQHRPPLERFIPERVSFMDPELVSLLKEMPELPLQGEMGKHIGQALDDLDRSSKEGRKICGVLTCNGETVVVMFPKPGQPILFDSHGRKYMEIPKGASVLQFNSTANLAKHLQSLFKQNNFSLVLLTTAAAQSPPTPIATGSPPLSTTSKSPASKPDAKQPEVVSTSKPAAKPQDEKTIRRMDDARQYLDKSINKDKKNPLKTLMKACSKFSLNRSQAAFFMEMFLTKEAEGALTGVALELLTSASEKPDVFIKKWKDDLRLNPKQIEAAKMLLELPK